jgi:hypothetical protein
MRLKLTPTKHITITYQTRTTRYQEDPIDADINPTITHFYRATYTIQDTTHGNPPHHYRNAQSVGTERPHLPTTTQKIRTHAHLLPHAIDATLDWLHHHKNPTRKTPPTF